MELIRNFKELNKNDAPIAGGKGASLGEMTQAGIPVPPGFVILSSTFDQFIKDADLVQEIDAILDKVDHKEIHTVENASEQIQGLIKSAKMPESIAEEVKKQFKNLDTEYVAVRSSATAEDGAEHAWAGQLDSFLNTTEKDLLEKVQHCWASLFTPRAIFYRFEKGLHTTQISVAVVVQKMVNSEISGIAFSVHPVTEDRNQLIIEAGFGLGEAIVSGQITPDSYVVEKEPRRIIDINVNTQARALYRVSGGGNQWQEIAEPKASSQVLNEAQILELSSIILGIEKHYGFPCDIEWAYENGKFYVVQSRPITTLSNQEVQAVNEIPEVWNKIWTTEYSLFSTWLFANQYVSWCKTLLGVGFHHVILHIEGDLATLYRNNSEQKLFIEGIGNKFLDNAFRVNAFKVLRDEKIKLETYLKLTPEKFLTPENIKNFIDLHNMFIPYFISVTWAPEALKDSDIPEATKDEVFRGCETIRKENENVYPRLERFLQDCFAYIAQKENVDEKLLRALLPDELLAYSREGRLPDTSTLKSRYNCAAIDAKTEKRSLLIGKEASDLIHTIYPATEVDTREGITGNSAFHGIITGKVRLVFKDEEQSKVQEGDILVTTMTRPEWIPSMKKAGAFVTDAGGILSHAAIVAREMNKPCIIGTKIATQVLKDGDLVEVDADNGVVRILEKANKAGSELKDIIPDLKNFTLTFSRPQSVLRDEIAYILLEKYADIPRLRVMTIPLEGTNRAIYVDAIFILQLFESLLNSISSTESFELHLKNYKKLAEDFEIVGKEVLKTGSNKQELLISYKKALRIIAGLGDYAWMPIPIEKILVPKFIELLKKELPDHWEEINHAVSSPVRLYGYQNMRLDICEVVISGQIDSEKIISELVDRHKWQGEYAYVEPLCEEEYFKTEFAKLTVETAQQEKGRILDEIKHNKKNLEKAMALIKNEALLLQARIINEYTCLRTDRVDLLKKLQVPVRGILDKVAEHLTKEAGKSWTRIEVVNLLNSEVIDYLSGKFVPDMDSVIRRGGGVYYRTRDEVKVITDGEIVQKVKDEMNASTDGIIKGTIAFKGNVKGLVKMVFSKTDISNVLPGDILVARTTMPDYTPAMEIASAFVTEEGGITSHAAIIARELKKPCIVGTGNCTKVLKDGDLVEVDADNGVVRILEKAK